MRLQFAAPLRYVSLLVAACLALPAVAQTYKWVDSNGVTNYSSTPPAKAASAKVTLIAPEKKPVYVPDDAPWQDAESRVAVDHLANRVDSLQRELDAERHQRQDRADAESRAAQAAQRAYERCVADRRVDCNDSAAYNSAAPVVIVRPRVASSGIVPTLPVATPPPVKSTVPFVPAPPGRNSRGYGSN